MEYLTNTEYKFKKSYKTGDSMLNNLKKPKKERRKERKQRLYQNRIPKQYKVYIKSIWWTKRKNRFYKENKRECLLCKSTKHCNIHHIAYRNSEFGNEIDSDLVCLCQPCHEEYHASYGTQGNMHDSFAEFCASKVNNPFV